MGAKGQALTAELAKNKSKIEDSLTWDDLDTEGKVERLRGYTKQALGEIVRNQAKAIESLQRRVEDLENHKHNSHGEVVVEKKLSGPDKMRHEVAYGLVSTAAEDPSSSNGGFI